ncbi:crossover junction endonuclease MUS81 isoform X2 [Triticum aestivum]|uniref:crossover junction endonuclease MUS81 isoform X2 n=1 Tax=Triticum aestivum TaxID=4565 RepID=UPI001D02E873|nr:crossover junction endonuclease MUS81-like isoform X2 [Triticum aestivum]
MRPPAAAATRPQGRPLASRRLRRAQWPVSMSGGRAGGRTPTPGSRTTSSVQPPSRSRRGDAVADTTGRPASRSSASAMSAQMTRDGAEGDCGHGEEADGEVAGRGAGMGAAADGEDGGGGDGGVATPGELPLESPVQSAILNPHSFYSIAGYERSGLPNSKAGSSSSFGNGRATNSPLSSRGMFGQQSFSAMGSAEKSLLAMPPHQSNESFLKAYEVVLILDDRDTFGPHFRRKVVDNIRSQFNIPVEIKHLPVGDALWIARHKELDMEYVLDFIVERKNVDDLLGSIKDNRYKDQKLRLKKCGLRKLIYLVEGDVNTVDGSESVKTACFTTELPEGFDVQRTTGL